MSTSREQKSRDRSTATPEVGVHRDENAKRHNHRGSSLVLRCLLARRDCIADITDGRACRSRLHCPAHIARDLGNHGGSLESWINRAAIEGVPRNARCKETADEYLAPIVQAFKELFITPTVHWETPPGRKLPPQLAPTRIATSFRFSAEKLSSCAACYITSGK